MPEGEATPESIQKRRVGEIKHTSSTNITARGEVKKNINVER